jgi:hypothetical protein
VTTDDAMDRAKKAFEVLKKNGDVLGVVKLRQFILGQGGKLKAKRDTLEPEVNEEDRRTLEKIAKLAGQLRDLGGDVDAFLPAK